MSQIAKKRQKIPTKPTENEELLLQTKTPKLGCELLSPHAMAGVWEPFLAEHSEWWNRYRHEPIYLLPEADVNQLAQNTPSVSTIHRAKKALIPENDAAAEHAFREACHRYPAGTIMAGLSGNYPLSSLGGRGEDASSEADAFRLWLMEKTVLSSTCALFLARGN